MNEMTDHLRTRIGLFAAHTPWLGLGRTILALASLSILLFTPMNRLMVPVMSRPDAPYCDGLKGIGLFCLGQGETYLEIARWIGVVVLLVAASGWRPRYTAIPHWYIAFSISQGIALPDGGDSVAQIATMLLIPLCLVDSRRWHWSWNTHTGPVAQSIAFATWWGLRLQFAGIYINSGLAKLGTDAWVNGTAEYFVARDMAFGVSGPTAPLLLWITDQAWGTALITWGTIILECAMGVLILCSGRCRIVALAISVLLHIAIIATMGLWSFGLIMIGGMIVCTSLDREETRKVMSRIQGLLGRTTSIRNENAHDESEDITPEPAVSLGRGAR